jgi:hypothetical protein
MDRRRPNLRQPGGPPICWAATLHVAAKQLQCCISRHVQLELQPASKLWPLCGVLETLSSTKSFPGSKVHRLLLYISPGCEDCQKRSLEHVTTHVDHPRQEGGLGQVQARSESSRPRRIWGMDRSSDRRYADVVGTTHAEPRPRCEIQYSYDKAGTGRRERWNLRALLTQERRCTCVVGTQ